MKWIIIGFCIIELIGAAVQYNDPDALFWIIVYLIPFFLNLVYLKRRHLRWVNIIVLVAYLLYFFTFIPDLVNWAQKGFPTIVGAMEVDNPYIELVREAGGVLILTVNLALLLRPIPQKV
ncbi:transmembrane 220 family protein [Membranicola marinus]|uniref:Transmembrane 220 family protein n=1 Tax=Membranihabitans marinus TaxID=1227546 RepID=A0A953HR38_9BACT|nr:transmembrane 220 family protein [Membranihabitans marinus]MBY5956845.1 transmembrane 220 family protein [Membranihabitans marinus]